MVFLSRPGHQPPAFPASCRGPGAGVTRCRRLGVVVSFALWTGASTLPAAADVLEDIGYRRLIAEAPGLSDGAGVAVMLIEAFQNDQPDAYFPDTTRSDLAHVEFSDGTGDYFTDNLTKEVIGEPSSHATSQAVVIASTNGQSMTPGVSSMTCFAADHWINRRLINGGRPNVNPARGGAPLANHSWVGTFASDADTLNVLRRIDWLIDVDDQLHVMASRNATDEVGSHAFNTLHVRETGRTSAIASRAFDDVYVAGRALVDLTVPEPNPSRATSRATSAAVLLRATASGGTMQPETLRAILMAGAERQVENSNGSAIEDYRGNLEHRSANGLDFRFGAGQLNVFNAHRIVSGGAAIAEEDGGGAIPSAGFAYDADFGGVGGSNRIATYRFQTDAVPAQFAATLAWNLFVADAAGRFDPAPVLVDLSLSLWVLDGEDETLVAASDSPVDNTETLWTELAPNRDYLLKVRTNVPTDFARPYALAWRIGPPEVLNARVPAVPGCAVAATVIVCGGIGAGTLRRRGTAAHERTDARRRRPTRGNCTRGR